PTVAVERNPMTYVINVGDGYYAGDGKPPVLRADNAEQFPSKYHADLQADAIRDKGNIPADDVVVKLVRSSPVPEQV
ncbi:MAG: hypothetical protein JWN43_1486, partial [Gammaproteobacteria bacterium]|nr:hypothetical protein [Gammaproteobacteria bacterium]